MTEEGEGSGKRLVWGRGLGVDKGPAGSCQQRRGWVTGLCRRNSGPWAGPGCHSPPGCWVSWSLRLGWAAGERVQEGGTRWADGWEGPRRRWRVGTSV